MALDSMQEILERMEAEDKPFWQVVQDTDREERQVTAEASEEKMRATWQAHAGVGDSLPGRADVPERFGGR